MDELVKLVTQKTGLPEEQAKAAVETVLGYLKANLPAPIAAQIDGLIAGGMVAQAASSLEGMLGTLGTKPRKG